MFDLPKYGDGIPLARVIALLDVLGVDRARLSPRTIVITGSNGKGSTAAFCASIGKAAALPTALFTSPHLYRYNERFQIDGEQISDARLAALELRVMQAAIDLMQTTSVGQVGAFEAQFALACLYAWEENIELFICEAGIGGRYDASRVLNAQLTCVTSVDFEHVNLLGNSLQLISADKSDACSAGGTIVYGENLLPLKAHLAAYNESRNVRSLFVREEIQLHQEHETATGQSFDLTICDQALPDVSIALHGSFQRNNAAIAASLFTLWRGVHADNTEAIRNGLATARWPGRLEAIANDPLTIIDVGHTPDGVIRARDSLFALHGANDWVLVLGVSADKNVDEIAAILAPSFATIICSSANHKGAPAPQVADAARKANATARIETTASLANAVQLSQTLARDTHQRVFVGGGLFIGIEYAETLRTGSAAHLNFF